MKKFFKLGKRMLALFIVVLLNINSYAAVGANDGSAFVTKAEFDALVNTFNEQMDSYQSGLNAKIDGSIANYLGGLSNVKTVDQNNLYNSVEKIAKNNKIYWYGTFSPESTVLADYCPEQGEVLIVKMANNAMYRVRVCETNEGGWSKYVTKEEKGKYYFVDENYALKEYWKDVYVQHYVSGSISDSNGNGLNVGVKSTFTCNSKTFLQSLTECGASTDTMSAKLVSGSTTYQPSCNLMYNLDLQKTVQTEFESGRMYSDVNTTNKIIVIKEDEKDKVTNYGTLNNKLGVCSNQYRLADGSWANGNVNGRPSGSGATGDKMVVYRPKSEEILQTVLTNTPVSTVYEESVKITDGVPLVKCSDDGTLKFDMTFQTDTAGASDYIKYGFKKNTRFLNNQDDVKIQDGLDTNITTAVATHNVKVSVEIRNLKKNDEIWMKAYPLTGNYATCKLENLVVQTD